jgi:hypothetical protein
MQVVKSGMYITIKRGDKLIQGKTKNSDKLVGGKILVYFDDGSKGLVSLHNIKIEGYYD